MVSQDKLRYGDLHLETVREACGLDFAHFTYQPGMCSCCYGPEDLPSIYWHNHTKLDGNYTYILFKNADNGSGCVKRKDFVKDITYVSWDFPMDRMESVCKHLKECFGDDFSVIAPKDHFHTITVVINSRLNEYIKDNTEYAFIY